MKLRIFNNRYEIIKYIIYKINEKLPTYTCFKYIIFKSITDLQVQSR